MEIDIEMKLITTKAISESKSEHEIKRLIAENKISLTNDEKRMFDRVRTKDIVECMEEKYEIDCGVDGLFIYTDGTVFLVDKDLREYTDSLDNLGIYELVDGVYIKKYNY